VKGDLRPPSLLPPNRISSRLSDTMKFCKEAIPPESAAFPPHRSPEMILQAVLNMYFYNNLNPIPYSKRDGIVLLFFFFLYAQGLAEADALDGGKIEHHAHFQPVDFAQVRAPDGTVRQRCIGQRFRGHIVGQA